MNIKIDHDIAYEERLLTLLGYKAINSDNSNRWIIMDENDNKVGFIQYKKIHNANKKKDLKAIFGYYMMIDSDVISYMGSRELNGNDLINASLNESFCYEFDIKNNDGGTNHLELSMGNRASLTLWSNEYGFISFHLDHNTLYFNYPSKRSDLNVEETILVKLNHRDGEFDFDRAYHYALNFCDKDKDIKERVGRTTIDITFKYKPYDYGNNCLYINESRWYDGRLIYQNNRQKDGSVFESIINHQKGIESFKYFRDLINKILPFKEEIISSMLKGKEGLEPEFLLFVPDLIKNDKKSLVKK